MRYRSQIFSAFVLGGHLASCGGTPTELGGNREETPVIRHIRPDPSFEVHVQEIFVRTGCTQSVCHGMGEAGLTLSSDAGANYRSLVRVPAESERDFLLVEPNDATNSYLLIRLEGRQRVGLLRMPIGPPLDSIDLTNIRNWINNGAPNN